MRIFHSSFPVGTLQAGRPVLHVHSHPEKEVLYRVIHHHFPTILDLLEHDPSRHTPCFILREFEMFLDCGVLTCGFARVRCPHSNSEDLLAFSCKCRGIWPSCCARCMAQQAAHLLDHVLPDAPLPQSVLTLPFELRYLECRHMLEGKEFRPVVGEEEDQALAGLGEPGAPFADNPNNSNSPGPWGDIPMRFFRVGSPPRKTAKVNAQDRPSGRTAVYYL